ncbi:hypothetical protein MIR68_002459 [Amoeboaphelidium protococcarum]|nr:hypothetical protein MIR68_002459 [Amoeboaphelidium protococcarum]
MTINQQQVLTGKITSQVLAHAFGQISLCCNGSTVMSCSDDSFIHVYSGVGGNVKSSTDFQLDTENRQSIELDSYATCIDSHGELLAYGCDDYQVCLVKLNALQDPKIILRSTLPVRSVRFSPDGKMLAVASDDMSLLLYKIADDSVQRLTGLQKSVIHMAFNPQSSMLACATCDGTVSIFKINDNSGDLVHTTGKLFKALEPESDVLKIDWSSDGKYVAVPGSKSVTLLDAMLNFRVVKTLSNHFRSDVNIAKFFNFNSDLIACGEDGGSVRLISIKDDSVLNSFAGEMKICDVLLMQNGSDMLFADSMGQISSWAGAVVGQDRSNDGVAVEQNNFTSNELIEKVPLKEVSALNKVQKSVSKKQDEPMHGGDISDLDSDAFDGLSDVDDVSVHSSVSEKVRSKPVLQLSSSVQSFQPASTPFKDGKRFMAFNMVGTIDSVQSDDYQSITIQYHDLSQRPINFKAIYPFTMAAMSQNAALFAANRISDEESGCVLYYKPFENWSQNAEWTLYLSAEEKIECIGIDQYIVIATNKYLRILTLSGLERFIFCIPGQVVSLSVKNDDLMLVYFNGSYKCQLKNISYQDSLVVDVPIKPAQSIMWLGFSSSLRQPGIYTDDGLLLAYIAKFNQWCPLLDTSIYSKDKTDFYWPIAFDDKCLSVIICKAGDKYPRFPKPIVSELDLKLPLMAQDSSQFEQNYLLNSVVLDESPDSDNHLLVADMDKNLLQMLQVAAKAKKVNRCVDLCKLLSLDKSLEIAYKLCQKLKLDNVCQKVEQLLQQRQMLQMEVETAPVQLEPTIRDMPSAEQYDGQQQQQVVAEVQPMVRQKLKPTFTPRKQINEEIFLSPAVIPSDQLMDKIAPPNPFKRKQDSSPVGGQQMHSDNMFSNVFARKQKLEQKVKGEVAAAGGGSGTTANGNSNDQTMKKRKMAEQRTLSFGVVQKILPAVDDVKPHVTNENVAFSVPNSQDQTVNGVADSRE